MHIKQTLLAVAVMAIVGSTNLAMAAPAGGSSSSDVIVGASNFPPPMASGNSGLQMLRNDGTTYSGFVDIYNAPINQVNNAVDNNQTFANWPMDGEPIAQVWRDTTNTVANIYSLRQTREIGVTGWPQFGGLVIGQVKGTGDAYPLGQGVYFGEWSPQDGPIAAPATSTNLNMAGDDRTVWYVGDDPVTETTMPSSIQATYNVVGIRQTGSDANGNPLAGGMPDNPNLYQGTLIASYSNGSGRLDGNISRTVNSTTQSVVFGNLGAAASTVINNDGTFDNFLNPGAYDIEGRFYNGAEALAGMAQGATVQDNVAFGGSKVSGTITP